MRQWTRPRDVVRKLLRRWDDGTYLTQYAQGATWEPLAIPITAPTPREAAARYADVRAWTDEWRSTPAHLRVDVRTVGGRTLGANDLPARAWVDGYPQLWALLDVEASVRRFTALLAATRPVAPRVADWMIGKPHAALKVEQLWTRLLDTVLWIEANANPATYLRQIDVPGVDTKFVEANRNILATLLDHHLDGHRVDPAKPPSDFEGRYRFRRKPTYIRFRTLGPAGSFSELTVRADELTTQPPDAATVYVVENEVTYLALPPADDAIAILGGGYAVSRLDTLDWLTDRTLIYWGDIDTHGFRILNNLRRRFPHARSVLMDRATLLAHEEHWAHEQTQVTTALPLLRPEEAELYQNLVENTLGRAVRLEQERIRFSTIERTLRMRRGESYDQRNIGG
jgi:hypothetical protein